MPPWLETDKPGERGPREHALFQEREKTASRVAELTRRSNARIDEINRFYDRLVPAAVGRSST